MTTNILSPHWQGQRAPAIDPDATPFKVAEAPVFADCQGCMFAGQRSSVCDRVAEIAIAAGDLDCESLLPNGRSLIYVADLRDPRQMDLITESVTNKKSEASNGLQPVDASNQQS